MNSGHGRDTVVIHINKAKFDIEVPIDGAELRRLGGIADANQLLLESHGQDPDVLIVAGQAYTLKNGDHLYDLPRGTVGGASTNEQAVLAVERLPDGRSDAQDDGTIIVRWRGRRNGPWTPRELEYLVVVPPLYPAQAPSGFDVAGPVKVNGLAPAGSGLRELAGTQATHFCWNPAGTIDYAAPDGLWRFAKFAETRLQEVA